MAYKVFSNGSVLNASDLNDYLMNQSVMVFADSAARASALTSPIEGMVTYLQDTNTLEFYNGTAWGAVAPASSAGLVHIRTESFSAVSSLSLNDIFSATYDHYKFFMTATGSTSDTDINFRYRVSGADESGANYNAQRRIEENTSIAGARSTSQTSGYLAIQPGNETVIEGTFFNPFLAKRSFTLASSAFMTNISTSRHVEIATSNTLTTSFTGITLLPGAGTITGKIQIWGYKA
jgi:hypothetical protein